MIALDTKLTLWLVLGVPVAVGWLLLVAILVRPPTRRGLAWWVLPVVALAVVAPVVWKVLLWLGHAIQPLLYDLDRAAQWIINHAWIPPVVVAAAAAVLVTVWGVRRFRATDVSEIVPVAVRGNVAPPVAIWSLPADAEQWDR